MRVDILAQRLELFPHSTAIEERRGKQRLTVGGCDLDELADHYGTPLYVYDQLTLDKQTDRYFHALSQHYPGQSRITYAGKAFLCTAVAQWAKTRRLQLDCTGQGEIHVAVTAGLAKDELIVHGVNKSPADLQAAITWAGTIVVDSLIELERLENFAHETELPELWLRLRPGMTVDTHTYIQTGEPDSKFGMNFDEAIMAVRRCQERDLPLTGIHFHLGSQIHDPAPVGEGIESALGFMRQARDHCGWTAACLSPGGGWGVAYSEEDLPSPPIDQYIQQIAGRVVDGCLDLGLALPRLQIEPGRSLAAQAGVAIYTVGAIKRTPNRRWLLIDGGLADNPRPALYGAKYSALPVREPGRPSTGPAWLGGPFCESGDILIHNLPLPEIEIGERLAIPVSGAYQLSMGSNYNGACRPAVVWLADGAAHLIQRRQMAADLTRRDLPLPA